MEVNATFYRLQAGATVAAWAETTPDGFLFSVKASRYLTHVRRLRELEQGIERFYDQLGPLEEAGKLGPVLWQLPANFHRDDDVLAAALSKLPPRRHCFEFRHRSWFAAPVYALLRDHGAAAVVADDARRPLPFPEPTADWTYARLHFGSRGRNGNYSAAELQRWRRRMAAWRARREVFAYLNNDWMAYAPRNARALV